MKKLVVIISLIFILVVVLTNKSNEPEARNVFIFLYILVMAWLTFVSRYDIRFWLKDLFWGEEKHHKIRIVRYGSTYGKWEEEFKIAVESLLDCNHKFSASDKALIKEKIYEIDSEKFDWREDLIKRCWDDKIFSTALYD